MVSPRIAAHLNTFGDRTAVVGDEPGALTYAQLAALVTRFAEQLRPERIPEPDPSSESAASNPARRLVALAVRNDLGSLVAYLDALEAGCVVLLTATVTTELVATYDPDIVIEPETGSAVEPGSRGGLELGTSDVVESGTGGGLLRMWRRAGAAHALHPELALLLSTSGSTGSPKVVRLSYANLLANARAIAEYLRLGENECAATTLPFYYCYG
ncbi:AMP-binding protein, partial [Nocardia crassostreae]|uniref:AMP-binding protein n=1 Tax=Nocardia crassostreae TaxID=53428 RepID=UPI000B1ECBD5